MIISSKKDKLLGAVRADSKLKATEILSALDLKLEEIAKVGK